MKKHKWVSDEFSSALGDALGRALKESGFELRERDQETVTVDNDVVLDELENGFDESELDFNDAESGLKESDSVLYRHAHILNNFEIDGDEPEIGIEGSIPVSNDGKSVSDELGVVTGLGDTIKINKESTSDNDETVSRDLDIVDKVVRVLEGIEGTKGESELETESSLETDSDLETPKISGATIGNSDYTVKIYDEFIESDEVVEEEPTVKNRFSNLKPQGIGESVKENPAVSDKKLGLMTFATIAMLMLTFILLFWQLGVVFLAQAKMKEYVPINSSVKFPEKGTYEYDVVFKKLRSVYFAGYDSVYDNLVLADLVTDYKVVELINNSNLGDFAQEGTSFKPTGMFLKASGFGSTKLDTKFPYDNVIVVHDTVEHPELFGTLQELTQADIDLLKSEGFKFDSTKRYAKVYEKSGYRFDTFSSVGGGSELSDLVDSVSSDYDLRFKKW